MMFKTARLSLLLFIFIILSQLLYAKQNLDSLLVSRSHQLTDYYRFKDGMKERTWVNMVNLNNKALQLIETDNMILNNHLELEMSRSSRIAEKLEKTNLEILLLNREIEVNSIMVEEQRFLNTNLVIITAVVIVLFVIVLILFIDRQIRYRSTRMELERFWARGDEQPGTHNLTEKGVDKQKEINSLTKQNNTFKQQLEEIIKQKSTQDNQLQKEINSRKEVESEIKSLISQIKTLS